MILALYLRLSKEDEDIVDESNSITNQRYILQKYVKEHPEFQGFRMQEYVDDGYSGKNFSRPGVTRLLEDVKSGRIYGIIVKDFSRFGRNHIEVGDYIEKIFPLLDIRFISVNNHFDSEDYEGTTPDMDVGFENLMYDYFSEENSIKIKNDLIKKRRRGNFMATSAPYGYIKSAHNRNQLIVDEEAAGVVRMIFEKYAECGVKAEVARYLNDNCILTPQEYAVEKGSVKHWRYEKEKKLWNGAIVGRILRNPVYIGNIVFHKTEALETASKLRKYIPREAWEMCEGTHEAIITNELFEYANKSGYEKNKGERHEDGTGRDQNNKKTGSTDYDPEIYCEGTKRRRGSKDSPIKGIVKCGGCGHHMVRRNRLKASYYCRHYYEVKSPGCCPHNIKEDELIELVRDAVCKLAVLAVDSNELMELYIEKYEKEESRVKKEKLQIQDKIEKCKDENFCLYDRFRNGEIKKEIFQELRQKNLNLIAMYQKNLDSYETGEDLGKTKKREIQLLLKGKEQITELTKEMVESLITEIYVYDKRRIKIVFKFMDDLDNLQKITGFDI